MSEISDLPLTSVVGLCRVIKSPGKRRQPSESPVASAAQRMDDCPSPQLIHPHSHISTVAMLKKCSKVNQRSSEDSPTTTVEEGLPESHQSWFAECSPPGVPVLGVKYPKVEEELDFYIHKGKQWKPTIEEEEAEETKDTVEKMSGSLEARELQIKEEIKCEDWEIESVEHIDSWNTDSAEHADPWRAEPTDSPTDNSLTDTMMMVAETNNSSSSNHQPSTAYEQHPEIMTAPADGSSSNSNNQQLSRANEQNERITIPVADISSSSSNNHQLSCASQKSSPPVIGAKTINTLDKIFSDLFTDGLKCLYCPLSLAQAVASVVQKRLTEKKASIVYCVSPSRLQMCLTHVNKLQKMLKKNSTYHSMLSEMRQYPIYDAVTEWLLRMRLMGRPPVIADVKQVAEYLGNKCQKTVKSMEKFLRVYGEPKMSEEEWAVLSPWAITHWHSNFHEHVHIRCGMMPHQLLTYENSAQVFTSTEILVSLGDVPREVTITRGRSNLYCLTRQSTGVFRAILTFSAAGQFLQPTILQRGYVLPHWALTEESVDLMASPNGKLDPLVFLGWLRLFEQRLTEADVPRPVVLFVHGHVAHGSSAADSFCRSKGIILHSHHHSPINLMDPFMYLLSPLLHHLSHTQKQLTSLTNTHPLPQYLLPSILADAWSQVSKEKLACEAFQRSGLLPYNNSKCFTSERFIQLASFPPVVLEPVKAYYACGDLPEVFAFDPEPQISTIYRLQTLHLDKKPQNTVKEVNDENLQEMLSPSTGPENREEVTHDNSDQSCDPLYVGPDPPCDLSQLESGRVIHIYNDMANMESSNVNSLKRSSEQELDELPLSCEIKDPVPWDEAWPTSPTNPQPIKTETDVIFDPQFAYNSTDFVSSYQDESDVDIKSEGLSPDRLNDDLWIKEEIEEPARGWVLRHNSEDDNLVQSSFGKESQAAGSLFIKMEPGDT